MKKVIKPHNFIDKLTEIERANRILFEKMTVIMNSEDSMSMPKQVKVNNTISVVRHNDSIESRDNNSKRTRNMRVRQRQLSKINQENIVNSL